MVEALTQQENTASGTDDDDINNKQFNSNYDMTNSKLQARFNAKKFMERERMKLTDIESGWKQHKYNSPVSSVLGVVPKMSPSDNQLMANDQNSSNFNYNFDINPSRENNNFAPLSMVDKRSLSESPPIHYNDQLSKEKNDLFQSEANSKLSKKEQDQKQPQANRELKRDVDGKIKLKISNKLMQQGLGAELPSDVYGFEDFYSKIKRHPLPQDEQQVHQSNEYQFKKIPNYNRFKRENNIRKLMSQKDGQIKIDENGTILKAQTNPELNTNDDDRQTTDKSTNNDSEIPTVQNNAERENFNYYDDVDVDDDNYSNNNYNSFDDEKDDPTTTIQTEMKNDNNESKFVANLLIDKSECTDNATIAIQTHASMQGVNNQEKMQNINNHEKLMEKRE